MALHLIDRPDGFQLVSVQRRSGFGAAVSGMSHLAIGLAFALALQFTPSQSSTEAASDRAAPPVTYIPVIGSGSGGRSAGGNSNPLPPRKVERVGVEKRTTTPPAPSPTPAREEPLEETTTLPVKSMADSTQALAGVIESQNTGNSLGPGDSGAGKLPDGPGRGIGNAPLGDGIGDLYRAGQQGVTNPAVLREMKPAYTPDAMRAKIQGSVWLECVVLPDGSIGDVRIVRSIDPIFGLDRSAVDAARQWRFRPGTLNGRPVPVLVTIELAFTLR